MMDKESPSNVPNGVFFIGFSGLCYGSYRDITVTPNNGEPTRREHEKELD